MFFPKAPCFAIVFAFCSTAISATAQETSIGYRVRIDAENPNLVIRRSIPCPRLVKLPTPSRSDSLMIRHDSIFIGSDSLLIANESIVIRNESCPASGKRTEWEPLPRSEQRGGWANIYKDATDTGILIVNFWTEVCDISSLRGTALDECRARTDSINGREYGIKFRNRESAVFPSRGLQIRALVLPLKLRHAYQSDTVHVRTRAEASISGNFFLGHRWGSEKYFYERGAARNPYTRFHITPGIFLGASIVSVGGETSRAATVRLPDSYPLGALSGGGGVLVGWRNISLGVFRGWDYGLGNSAKYWDFNQRPYWAFGITFESLLDAKL
jgi:hypothetical protein